jgi:hypothetical protein
MYQETNKELQDRLADVEKKYKEVLQVLNQYQNNQNDSSILDLIKHKLN